MNSSHIKKVFSDLNKVIGVRAELLPFNHKMYPMIEQDLSNDNILGACYGRGSSDPLIILNRNQIENCYRNNKNLRYYVWYRTINADINIEATTLQGLYELIIIHELTHAQNVILGIKDYDNKTEKHLHAFYPRHRENLIKYLVYKTMNGY